MSRRSRTSRSGGHAHCESCYSRRCRRRVEASVSCALASCRLHCGALFHLCKEEEHLLLCPNVRTPCINAAAGCPLQLPRAARAAHLAACPASVVSCSMEWNRWPANDAHSHLNTELHDNLLKEGPAGGGALDLAMALKDQDRLFHALKMKKLFPELVRTAEEEEQEEQEEEREAERRRKEKKRQREEKEAAAIGASGRTWESFTNFNIDAHIGKEDTDEEEEEEEARGEVEEEERELTQEEREALATAGLDADVLHNYNAWERMFSMEMGGCREAAGTGRGRGRGRGKGGLGAIAEEEADAATTSKASGRGAPSCSSSSSSACAPARPDFEYCHVEPMKIITVRTFKIPTSFCARQGRIRNPNFYRRESKAVDTSDLEVAPDAMPVWDEVQASLLCSLERELRGHMIAETVCSDTLLQDEGTQTYSFLSAPFRRATSLAHLTAARPAELHLQLQAESVTSRHHKASSAFTFLCGHSFQRAEFGQHYKNVHSDIQMGVSGWFEQRCPLAYLGCTFSRRRFRPNTHDAAVSYNADLGCFSLHPSVHVSLDEASGGGGGGGGGGGEDALSALPYEVLCHMAGFLDSLSLSQLSLVSRLMRQVCWSLLEQRGMVSLRWERKTSPGGGARWTVKDKVWHFSTLFSPVDAWRFRDEPPLSEHLKACPFYETEVRTERVRLPRVHQQVQTDGCKGQPTLLSLFQQKKIMM